MSRLQTQVSSEALNKNNFKVGADYKELKSFILIKEVTRIWEKSQQAPFPFQQLEGSGVSILNIGN